MRPLDVSDDRAASLAQTQEPPMRSQVSHFTTMAVLAAATTLLAACSGGGATIGATPGGGAGSNAGAAATPTPSSTGGGSGAGSGSGATASPTPSGGGSGTGSGSGATPTPTPGSGGSGSGGSGSGTTATPTPTPGGGGTGSGGGSGSGATPTPTPTPTATAAGLATLTVGPSTIDALVGSVAQIGILSPGSTSPFTVQVQGGGLTGAALTAVSALNGTVVGNSSGVGLLNVNVAQLLSVGAIGPNGLLLNICMQSMPLTCQSVNLINSPTTSGIISSLSSAVLNGPGQGPVLSLLGLLGSLTNFTVTASDKNISIVNLGSGQFRIDANANVTVPLTGSITIDDGMGHKLTIPLQVV